MNTIKSLPVQLVLCVFGATFIGGHLSLDTISGFFTVSCVIKECLMAVLPLVVFSYIFAAILSMEQRAPRLLISILVLVCLSNAAGVLVSYGVGVSILPLITIGGSAHLNVADDLVKPLFAFNLPSLLSPDKAMLAGMIAGMFFSFVHVKGAPVLAKNLKHYVTLFLQKSFIPVLPLYVLGFVLKMQHEGTLNMLLQNYGQVFALTCILIFAYLYLAYFVASRFSPSRTLASIRNMLPAGLTGFSTMSSAATMPITLAATEKNTQNPSFAQLVVPSTVNVHLMGDALAIPILGFTVLMMAGQPLPSFETYLVFMLYFCLAKFSAAGIPGGGIIVLLPVLQQHMGLTPEMVSLVTTLYILQDPIFTGANVMGNGAFAMISDNLCSRLIPSPAIAGEGDFDLSKSGEGH